MPIVSLEQVTAELLHDVEEIVVEDARHYADYAVVWRKTRSRRTRGECELLIRVDRLDRHSLRHLRKRLAELGLDGFDSVS